MTLLPLLLLLLLLLLFFLVISIPKESLFKVVPNRKGMMIIAVRLFRVSFRVSTVRICHFLGCKQ
jgi:hypothetical protein